MLIILVNLQLPDNCIYTRSISVAIIPDRARLRGLEP